MIGSSAAPFDVLYVGREEPPDLRDLERAGLRVERTPSLVHALDCLRNTTVAVAIVHADTIAGLEEERFDALRSAGAGAVLGLYPPAMAWRADRALSDGADAALALPTGPGVLLATTALLARASTEPSAGAEPSAGRAARRTAPGTSGDPAPPAMQPVADPPAGPPPQLPAAPSAPVPVVALPRVRPWMEGLVAEVATMNRVLEQFDRVLDQVHGAFQRRSGAERCSILLYDRRRTQLSVRRASRPLAAAELPAPVAADGLAAHVGRTGASLLLADVGTAPPDVAHLVSDQGRGYRSRSCLILPLRGAEDVVGVACLTDRRDAEPFRASDVPPLELLADQAGQAIENAAKFRQLQQLASVDELTGLANRRQFQASLEREVQRARRYDRQLTLCILDLDHFKQYNDRCGHQAGDQALATVGEILRTSFREADVVARYGGEEFAVILPETAARPAAGANNPFPFLERLRRRIEEAPFEGEEKLPNGKLTVSGGVACFPDDASTLDDLVREADRSLYVSKSRGRNTITYRGKTLSD